MATLEAQTHLLEAAKELDKAVGKLFRVDTLEDGTDCAELKRTIMALRDSVYEVEATIRRSKAAFAWPKAHEA